jgi:predicted  nucleic acid-binding Zn-ribbon protein
MFRTCKKCGERVARDSVCPTCGSKSFKYESAEDEVLEEDIIVWDDETGQQQEIIAKKGDSIPYYKIKKLPFVIRRNVSDPKSLYGISDIDILENCQESSNKLLTKMEQNVLKGGSIVTVPDKTTIKFDDEPLKQVPIKDPKLAAYFTVSQVQANIQQEDILQSRMYENGRVALGITDSYQGKRDPTAESGKAKEISAAQAAGRLESKRRMKEAAYGDLYSIMFKFLLAYCDEKRTYARMTPEGSYIEGKFNRYNFLDGEKDNVYYNDRFLFSVDSASVLGSDRQAL